MQDTTSSDIKSAFNLKNAVRLLIGFLISQILNKESLFNRVLLGRLRDLFGKPNHPRENEKENEQTNEKTPQ